MVAATLFLLIWFGLAASLGFGIIQTIGSGDYDLTFGGVVLLGILLFATALVVGV